jgi:hypothetical protein
MSADERPEQPQPEPQPAKTSRAQLASRVLELRRRGASVRDIAATLGLSKSAAGRLLKKALAGMQREAAELERYSVALEAHRLEGLTLALNRRLADESMRTADFVRCVNALVGVAARKARLLALDREPRIQRPPELPPMPQARPIDDNARLAAILALLSNAAA